MSTSFELGCLKGDPLPLEDVAVPYKRSSSELPFCSCSRRLSYLSPYTRNTAFVTRDNFSSLKDTTLQTLKNVRIQRLGDTVFHSLAFTAA